MRTLSAVLLCLLLLCAASVTVLAGENATISATVPGSHTLTASGEGAGVWLEGVSDTSFSLGRLSEPRLLIRPGSGRRITRITLNGKEITRTGGYFRLPAVFEDQTLLLETEAAPPDNSSRHSVDGLLRGVNGEPIAGATVELGGKTAVTDENGGFHIEALLDGYHPVMVTDRDGLAIAYTELTLGQGDTALSEEDDGFYLASAKKNAALSLTAGLREDGTMVLSELKDVTKPSGGSPGTGEALFLLILFAASAAVTAGLLAKKRGTA